MIKVSFYRDDQVSEDQLKYAVIAARYQDKWIFCRHRERSTWEVPGGHHEPDETIEETARRELWEETGATLADIRPVSVYGVEKDGVSSYGKLFYADVHTLENLPETFEIAEIRLADFLPEKLTYPDIQPVLFEQIQHWMNTQSNAGELW